MGELVRMDEIAKDIRYGKTAKETEALAPLTRLQENWLKKDWAELIFPRQFV